MKIYAVFQWYLGGNKHYMHFCKTKEKALSVMDEYGEKFKDDYDVSISDLDIDEIEVLE